MFCDVKTISCTIFRYFLILVIQKPFKCPPPPDGVIKFHKEIMKKLLYNSFVFVACINYLTPLYRRGFVLVVIIPYSYLLYLKGS